MKIDAIIHKAKVGWTVLIAVAALAGAANPASAATPTLFFSPSDSFVGVGGSRTFDLKIKGLDRPPALGAWAVDITYDDAIVQIDGVTFGTFLGPDSDQFLDLSTGSLIISSEVSFELPVVLLTQPSEFTLATVAFTGLVPGVSPLEMDILELSDENGDAIDDRSGVNGTVSVRGVPDGVGIAPAALAWGFLFFVGARCQLRKSRTAVG